jgi:hypothetical protein
MARYRILRIYEVPADNRYQATNRMMEAILLGTEKDYHMRDVIRLCENDAPFSKVELRQPTGWWTILMDQLFGSNN